MSKEKDFFQPIHLAHLDVYCEEIIEYLALPSGWRFLIAPNQTEVWFDKKLLQ